MKLLYPLFFLLCLINHQLKATDIFMGKQVSSTKHKVPIQISVRSVQNIRVKENQRITIGQILASRPPEYETPQGYISTQPEREVTKQKAKLARIKQIVEEENLPKILIQHEEAKLRDLEFAAKEHKLLSNQPKAFKETVYKSPVNGAIRRITPLSSSDGLLTVELLVELD